MYNRVRYTTRDSMGISVSTKSFSNGQSEYFVELDYNTNSFRIFGPDGLASESQVTNVKDLKSAARKGLTNLGVVFTKEVHSKKIANVAA